jgi:hypothetical protein
MEPATLAQECGHATDGVPHLDPGQLLTLCLCWSPSRRTPSLSLMLPSAPSAAAPLPSSSPPVSPPLTISCNATLALAI